MGWAEASAEMPEGCRKDADIWTPDLVEGRLMEAIGFLDRVVPSGRNPFATDGPWSQIIRNRHWGPPGEVADWVEPDEVREREARGRGGLNVAQYERMAEALEWSTFVQDRKGRLRPLMGVVLQHKMQNGTQVDWAEVKRRLRSKDSHDCLRMAYGRALSAIAIKLTARSVPVSP